MSQAMGAGTGIPAALGAIIMNQGKITEKGVFPPEGGVNPLDFLKLANKAFDLEGVEEETGESTLLVESIDHEGKVKKITL